MEPIRPITTFWFLVGIVLVIAGITGSFGALLAALLAPEVLEES